MGGNKRLPILWPSSQYADVFARSVQWLALQLVFQASSPTVGVIDLFSVHCRVEYILIIKKWLVLRGHRFFKCVFPLLSKMLFAGCIPFGTCPGTSFGINRSGTGPHGNLPRLPYARLLALREFNRPLNMLLCLQGRKHWSREFSLELNHFLQKWCCVQVKEGNRAIFAPSYKVFFFFFFFFSKQWQAVAWPLQVGWERLSNVGLQRSKQCLQQALSDSNFERGAAWKRRSAGRPGPCFHPCKVRGSLIIF